MWLALHSGGRGPGRGGGARGEVWQVGGALGGLVHAVFLCVLWLTVATALLVLQ